MVETLMVEAGTTRVIHVEISTTEVQISVVRGRDVTSFAYRNGQISTIDSDIEYVGQAIFDPRGFNLETIDSLFAQAATWSGSSRGQRLQILDYSSGDLYMAVTTNPETLPVFFDADGELVRPIVAKDLGTSLAEFLEIDQEVVRVGVEVDGTLYADIPAGEDQVWRILSNERFPTREHVKSESNQPESFHSSMLTNSVLDRLITSASIHLKSPVDSGITMVIECEMGERYPSIHVSKGGTKVVMHLDGTLKTK
jgi:hypothetical protein